MFSCFDKTYLYILSFDKTYLYILSFDKSYLYILSFDKTYLSILSIHNSSSPFDSKGLPLLARSMSDPVARLAGLMGRLEGVGP